jgi:hypothetical protein
MAGWEDAELQKDQLPEKPLNYSSVGTASHSCAGILPWLDDSAAADEAGTKDACCIEIPLDYSHI